MWYEIKSRFVAVAIALVYLIAGIFGGAKMQIEIMKSTIAKLDDAV